MENHAVGEGEEQSHSRVIGVILVFKLVAGAWGHLVHTYKQQGKE